MLAAAQDLSHLSINIPSAQFRLEWFAMTGVTAL
jgi:hypothetical protein